MSSIFLWPPLFTLVIIWACRYNALLLSASVHQRWWSVFGEAGWYINTVRIGIIIRHLFLGPSVHQWRRSIFEEASWNIKIRTGVIFRLLCCLLAFFIQTCRDNTLLFCPRVHQRRWPLFGKAGCIEVRLSSVIRIDYWIWHSGPTWQIGMHWSWSVVHFFPVTSIESCCAFCLKPLIQFWCFTVCILRLTLIERWWYFGFCITFILTEFWLIWAHLGIGWWTGWLSAVHLRLLLLIGSSLVIRKA